MATLKERAEEIRDETRGGYNTADRLGGVLVDMVSGMSVSVKEYGAVGDGVTDDTEAVQECIDDNPGKVIKMPAGRFVISELQFSENDYTFCGEGVNSVIVIKETNKNIITVSDATKPVYGVTLRDFKIEKPNAVTLTAGAGILLDLVRNFTIQNVILDDTFIGLKIQGGTQVAIDNLLCLYENTNGGIITGRKFIQIGASATTLEGFSKHSGDLFFSNTNGRCGSLDYCDVGLEINACDGVWFNNFHFGNCATANVLIDANSTIKCTGVLFNNGWIDIAGGKGLHIKGSTPTNIGDYYIQNTKFYGGTTGTEGVLIEGTANNVVFNNCPGISGYKTHGINIAAGYTGNKVIIKHCVIQNNSTQTDGGGDGIIYSSSSFVEIVSNYISGNSHNRHINIDGVKAAGARIDNNTLIGTPVTERMQRLQGTGISQINNIGFNPTGKRTITLGNSPYAYSNTFGYPLEIIISGGTVTEIKKGAEVLTDVTSGTFIIASGETITITYSAPCNLWAFGI